MRFLVVMDAIGTGGISSAFLNYINYVSKSVECDVLIFNDVDAPTTVLPTNIHVLKSNNALRMLGMSQKRTKQYSSALACIRAILVGLSKVTNGRVARRLLLKFAPKLDNYDVAISYAQDVNWKSLARGCNDYVLRNVNSYVKAAFVHCDYKHFGGYDFRQEQMYGGFDFIFGVSKGCCKSFSECFPSLSDKVCVSENFIDISAIRKKSQEYQITKENLFNIVTICRVSEEKGIKRMLRVVAKLAQDSKPFKWTIVGGGNELESDKLLTNELGINQFVNFVGEKKNPFPYLKNADVFLLPSYHEAAPMVFGESCVLEIPIISTETSSARELVEDRNVGIVCDNTEDGLYDVISKVLREEINLGEIKKKEASFDVNMMAEIQFKKFVDRIGKI